MTPAGCESDNLAIAVTIGSERSATLYLRGTIDLATTEQLQSAVTAVLALGRSELTLDLTGVCFAGVSALEAMLAARHRCAAAGGWLGLRHIPPVFRRALAVTELGRFFTPPAPV